MHDTLGYFSARPRVPQLPPPRAHVQHAVRLHENFILPLSHDEVVHGKRSLSSRWRATAGRDWRTCVRCTAYMWAHPGKKLLFMGGELAQEEEWNYQRSVDWHLLERPEHAGVQRLVRDLNHRLRQEPALYEQDVEPAGFWWLEANDAASNVFAFARACARRQPTARVRRQPVTYPAPALPPRASPRRPLDRGPQHRLRALRRLRFGNPHGVEAEPVPWHGQNTSAEIALPPLAVIWLVPSPSGD